MLGPWLPICGTGGAMALILLKKTIAPLFTFGLMIVLSGVVEYFTSWYLEYAKGMKWWDYTGYFMNLNGRICLEGLLVFGLASCMAIYIVVGQCWMNYSTRCQRKPDWLYVTS